MDNLENMELLVSHDFNDEFDEVFHSLETEVFKVGLLSDWLVYHEGIPEHMASFLGAFFQTADYLKQCFDELKLLHENAKVGVSSEFVYSAEYV